MAHGRLLVVAPDPEFGASLAFALEAEGYAVTVVAAISAVVAGPFDCVILDHKAAVGHRGDVVAFCRRNAPVVLLASTPLPWLVAEAYRSVQKPLLGEPLSVAVRAAVDQHVAGSH